MVSLIPVLCSPHPQKKKLHAAPRLHNFWEANLLKRSTIIPIYINLFAIIYCTSSKNNYDNNNHNPKNIKSSNKYISWQGSEA